MRILGKFRSDLCNKTLVLEFGSSKKHIHQDTLRALNYYKARVVTGCVRYSESLVQGIVRSSPLKKVRLP